MILSVTNIVARGKMDFKINLECMYQTLYIEYRNNPELEVDYGPEEKHFCGLFVKRTLNGKKVSYTFFRNGSIIVAGLKSLDKIDVVEKEISDLAERFKFIELVGE